MTTKQRLPLSEEELVAYEATRDLYAELKQTARDLKAGLGRVVYSPMIAARWKTGLSEAEFANLLGITTLTLEDWEQQRKEPTEEALAHIARILDRPEPATARQN